MANHGSRIDISFSSILSFHRWLLRSLAALNDTPTEQSSISKTIGKTVSLKTALL